MASIKVKQFTMPTATGNQEYTIAGWGETPKAAMFLFSAATANDTAADNAALGVGFTDGTRDRCICGTSENAEPDSDTYRWQSKTKCVRIIIATDAIDGEATGIGDGQGSNPGPIANGWRLNWTDAPSSAWRMTVIFFAGSDLSVHVNHTTGTGASVPFEVDVTDPGFEPDQVICTSIMRANDNSWAHNMFLLGFVDNGASVVHRSIGFHSLDFAAKADVEAHVRTDFAVRQIWADGGFQTSVLLKDFDSSGFTARWEVDDDANDSDVMYLALKYGGGEGHWIGTIDTKTSTTTQAYTDPGFKPQALILAATFLSVVDTEVATEDAGSIGIGAASSATDEASNSMQDEDNVVTMDTQSMADVVIMNLPKDDGTVGLKADLSSFDTNGFTLSFTYADGTARKWIGLAVEEAGAAGQSATPDTLSVNLLAIDPTTTKGAVTPMPATLSVPLGVASPSVSKGAVSRAVSPLNVPVAIQAPTVSKLITRSLDPLTPALTVQGPSVTKGTATISAGVLAPKLITITPTVITVGVQTATPDPLSLPLSINAPAVTKGAVSTSAPVLTPSFAVVAPTVSKPIARAAGVLSLPLSLIGPTVSKGGATTAAPVVTPALAAIGPTVTKGAITATAGVLTPSLATVTPSYTLGGAAPHTATPNPVTVALATVAVTTTKGPAATSATALSINLVVVVPNVAFDQAAGTSALSCSLSVVAPLRVATWSTAGPPFSIFRYDAANWLSTDDWYVEAMVDCITPSMFLELFDDTDNVPVAGSLTSIGAIPDEYTRLRGGPCTENLQDGHDYRVRVGSGIGADGNAYAAKIVNVR